jgi:tRNA A58 N-methylase Trm61
VLDIGCGSGTSTIALAERVGPAGRVFGIDIAAESVEVARRRIDAAGLAQAEVLWRCGDPSLPARRLRSAGLALRGDVLPQPIAAFAHLRAALRPGHGWC